MHRRNVWAIVRRRCADYQRRFVRDPPRHLGCALAIALVMGCIRHPSYSTPESAAPIAPAESDRVSHQYVHRLSSAAIPRRYELHLRVDPRSDTFDGDVAIDVEVSEPTNRIVLHARNLNLRSVIARFDSRAVAGASTPVADGDADADEAELRFPNRLPRGPLRLELAFDGVLSVPGRGLYRKQVGERWYAFTALAPVAARSMYPCFDEPSFKAPLDLTVTVPTGMLAVANMPESSRQAAGEWTTIHFMTSPPLPPFLVALAIGDFEVESDHSGRVEIRWFYPRGTGIDTFLPRLARDLVGRLETALGQPFPFPKLDLMSVPGFYAGAMASPGLVMFREGEIPARAGASAESFPEIWFIAQEVVHQWAQDMVTPSWWNDRWIMQGLASLFAERAASAVRPPKLSRLAEPYDAMVGFYAIGGDDGTEPPLRGVVTTSDDVIRAIRSPIVGPKAAHVMRMLERWIGPEAFAAGVRTYLRERAWQSTTTEDFVRALERASGKTLGPIVESFVDTRGMPIVRSSVTCEGPRMSTITLSEQPPRVTGEANRSAWTIPVCIAAQGKSLGCAELSDKMVSFDVRSAEIGCSSWLDLNPGLDGYYEQALTPQILESAAHDFASLSEEARFEILRAAFVSLGRRELRPTPVLGFLPLFDNETDIAVEAAETLLLQLIRGIAIREPSEPAFRRYVGARLGHLRRFLGDSGFPPPDGVVRSELDFAHMIATTGVGYLAQDPGVVAKARGAVIAWAADPATATDSVMDSVDFRAASVHPDASLFGALVARAENGRTVSERLHALIALSSIEDPALLRRGLDVFAKPRVNMLVPSVLKNAFNLAVQTPEGRGVLLRWASDNWQVLRNALPGRQIWAVLQLVGTTCGEGSDSDVTDFEARARREAEILGMTKDFESELERRNGCRELTDFVAPEVVRYFSGAVPSGPR